MNSQKPLHACTLLIGAAISAAASAQALPSLSPTETANPSAAPAANSPSSPSAVTLPAVLVRANDEDETRRQSSAAKIVIGRAEIERYADSTLSEMLKRLPGITVAGRPGRGGAPAMRGLGNGYTQILIDGERAARGFSLDEIAPEQIERIEILRAPTAETGARAIAGTINIVTRGGYRKHVNSLNTSMGMEHGQPSRAIAWSRNDSADALVYNLTLSAAHFERTNDSLDETITDDLSSANSHRQEESIASTSKRDGLHANARLQWSGSAGDSLTVTPMAVFSHASTASTSRLDQSGDSVLADQIAEPLYAHSIGQAESDFATLRLSGVWLHRLDRNANFRLTANLGQSHWSNLAQRLNLSASDAIVNSSEQNSEQQDKTLSLTAKHTRTWAETHDFVLGLELESNRRNEVANSLQNGQTPLSDFDGNLNATAKRLALYAQDEWAVTPHWSTHAGLRWESIKTQGSVTAESATLENQSAVLTPLVHAVWRPNLAVKDQFRLSLTRSYRSPNLSDLIARPRINSMYLNRAANVEVHPDHAGNPALKAELASGLDLAYEHYLAGGGMLSANLFLRQIQDYLRNQTALETVSWADVPRWVSRRQNVGHASTQGIELEAKFQLNKVWPNLPAVDVRSNLSLFRSQVAGIAPPDNRLDRQPDRTANLGADYAWRGVPLKIGANINWTPAFTTRLSDDQTLFQSSKAALDSYLLWSINPNVQLRITLSNLSRRDYLSGGSLVSINSLGQPVRESTQNTAATYVNVAAKLEVKL